MDDEQVKVDVIIVGGGPAGLAAAYTLAKKDMEVILVERGEFSGSKSLGGLLYGTVLNELIPNFWESAPIERPVVKRQVCYLGEKNFSAVTFGSQSWGEAPFNYTYTVHRSQFDKWFSQQVEAAGASLLEGMVVDGLIYEGEGEAKKAKGVRIRGDEGHEEFFADMIILCDGAHCLVTQEAMKELNMKSGGHEQHFAVGVKETIGLDKSVIEDRFGLNDGEGAALDFIGVPFDGLVGGGFIYTQKETVSIGAAAKLETVKKAGLKPNELLDTFKRHPEVKKMIRGGELLEYGAHLIPEGGYDCVAQMAANGVMICGDAAGLVNMSLYKEGTNHAMESGKLAAETAIEAKEKGDFSYQALRAYEDKMKGSIAMQDLEKYRNLPEILDTTPAVLSEYPDRATQMLVDYFTVSMEPKKAIQKRAIKDFFSGLSKIKLAKDMFRARKLM